MGKPDLFAKRTFASQTEPLTDGAASWKEAPEIGLEQIKSDGILVIHDPALLKELAAPWRLVTDIDEILVEFKMQGDHVDLPSVSRTLLRRQARETQRCEERKKGQPPWLGRQTMWVVSAYIPEWAKKRYRPDQLELGCYRWAKEQFTGLWIASNELPLRDELVPFLITRTGQRMSDFLMWAIEKNFWPLLVDLVLSLSMLSKETLAYLKYDHQNVEDEEAIRELQPRLLELIQQSPTFREIATRIALGKLVEPGALREAQEAVVRVLRARKLEVRPHHVARIDGCMDITTLHLWLTQAAIASSVEEALATD